MKPLLASLVFLASLASAQARQSFTGVVTDSMCPAGDHSPMRMGPTSAECAIACVDAHGAAFVLYDGKTTFGLSDQKAPEKFVGKKVTVTGTLDAEANAIRVETISEAK